ncbi:MAG: helix-turn-helix transcriptional regulator [Betaproteobacteria bacterium]
MSKQAKATDPAYPCTSREVLDTIRAPLFLLQPSGMLAHVNPAGQRMLELNCCVARVRGFLVCHDRESQKALETALAEIAKGAASRAVFTLRSLNAVDSLIAVTLSAVRQCPPPRVNGALDLVLMAVTDRSISKADPDEICAAFRLTRTEARIAGVIVDGMTPSQCAELLQVSVSTVRTHLISIYRKTGASSQLHLARMILPLTLF